MTVHSLNFAFFVSLNSYISLEICFPCISYSYFFPWIFTCEHTPDSTTMNFVVYIFLCRVYSNIQCWLVPAHACFIFIYFHLFWLHFYSFANKMRGHAQIGTESDGVCAFVWNEWRNYAYISFVQTGNYILVIILGIPAR